jgi:hypothetical protein
MSAAPRVGGYVMYRKPGQNRRTALVSWIYPDGSMRVEPLAGRRTTITPADVARADKPKRCRA